METVTVSVVYITPESSDRLAVKFEFPCLIAAQTAPLCLLSRSGSIEDR
jgi:hypothetical protein